jgi:hypothetical protein
MFLLPTQSLPARQLLKLGLKLWRKDYKVLFWLILGTAIVGSLPYIIYSIIKPQFANIAFFELFQDPGFIFILFIFNAFTLSAIFYRIYMFIHDQPGGGKRALTVAFQRLPYTFIAILLVSVLVALGFLLFFIPGLILSYYLSMTLPLVIVNNENPFYALRKSYELVKNHWWHTFDTLILAVLPFWIFNLLIYFALSKISFEAMPFYRNILQLILWVIYYPYISSVFLLLFHDLKLRKGIKKF